MMESRAPIDTGAARARLDPGARVSTFGLSKAEFNDHRGTVLGKLKNGRYIVLLDEASASLSPIKVRIENLQVLEHVSPNFERLAEYALTSDAIRKEADIDALTDHIATGNFSEAQVAEVLVDALVLHVLPTDDLIASNQEYHCRWTSPVATGEYVICNVNTRPELNGQVCSVSGGMYGRAEFATNNVQVHTTGELILLHNNKLVPLEEAPAILLYDEADLALDEHPLHSASNLVQFLSLPNPKPFAVRVHGLTSASGAALNGQIGQAFRDNENGRLAVRFSSSSLGGEPRSLRIDNLSIPRVHVSLPAGEAPSELPAHNAASRTAGSYHAADSPQPGFFVYTPPLGRGFALEWHGSGWPGVYTDRRLAGVATAPAEHVTEVGTLRAAMGLWEDHIEREGTRCPYVLWMCCGPVADDVTARELFDLFRWFLAATDLGQTMASQDGVGIVGAHVEPPSVLAGDLDSEGASPVAHIIISLCSDDVRYYADDVLSALEWSSAPFRLCIRGRPILLSREFCEHYDASEPEGAIPKPPKKRRVDDWMEKLACCDAPFTYESWKLRYPPKSMDQDHHGHGFMKGPLVV